MGVAQGKALRERIHLGRRQLRRLEAFRMEQPWWLPFPLFRRLAERKVASLVGPGIANVYPEMQSRLQGMGRGAGVPLGSLLLLNGFEPLMASVEGRTNIPPMPEACSAVAIRGSRSANGQPMVAHNFDYLPIVQPFYSLRESRPAGGLRSLEFTMAPLAGTIDGINEAGLCITYNYAFTLDRPAHRSGFISMAISEALARCRTTAEASEWIQSRPRWGGGLLMLADAQGDIASLELSSSRASVRRPENGQDAIFHTNCFFTGGMCEIQVPSTAVFTGRVPQPLRGRRVLQSADLRRARLEELLAQDAVLDADGLRSLLSDHGPDGRPSDDTLCIHGSYWSTTASLQFFPARRAMRLSYSSTCQAKYVEFGLN